MVDVVEIKCIFCGDKILHLKMGKIANDVGSKRGENLVLMEDGNVSVGGFQILENIKFFDMDGENFFYVTRDSELYYYNPLLYNFDKRHVNIKQKIPIFISRDVKNVKMHNDKLYYVLNDGKFYEYKGYPVVENIGENINWNEPVRFKHQVLIKKGVNNIAITEDYYYITDDMNQMYVYEKENMNGKILTDKYGNILIVKVFETIQNLCIFLDSRGTLYTIGEYPRI